PAFDAMVNVTGSANLIKGCIEGGVRKVVYAASGGTVYDEPYHLPVDESHPVRPLSPYGLSKHTVERYLELYSTLTGLRFTVFRYPNIYGPRQKPAGEAGVVAIFAYQMLRGEQPTIFGNGNKTRDYVYVSDVVRANLAAIERGDGGIYNLGTAKEITDQEVFDTVAMVTGYKGRARYAEVRSGEICCIALDATKAYRELGWEATVPFGEGVALTVDYVRGRL
ncbi:MAG: NAD-dependent epimerase/dehydratase family protein, partial [Dehalococcoidia bacterium]|nr:NAD-dependent epimerase/dehydratase family protein [Dehalococcoidia bacterium]